MSDSADTLDNLLATRYSCRSFRPDPVPIEIINRILAMAGRTASNNNAQPWGVTITSGNETERLREALYAEASGMLAFYGKHASYDADFPLQRYSGPYKERRRSCGEQLYQSVGITREQVEAARLQSMENYKLFGAPHMALITTTADMGTWGAIDCGAYTANFLLAAHSLGVATVPQGAFSIFANFLRRHFELAEDRLIVCGISFGYANAEAPINQFRTPRAATSEYVQRLG